MRQTELVEKEKPILATCGDTGLKESYGILSEEFHPNLAGDRWLRVAEEMGKNEGNIAASHLLIEMMVRNTPRTIVKNESGHPRAAEAQEYIDGALHDQETSFPQRLGYMVTAIQWGYAWLEILYKIRKGENDEPRLNSEFDDGRYGWRDWSPRAQSSRDKWVFTDEGRLLGMWQMVDRRTEHLYIPRKKSIHIRFRDDKDNPEGISFYRPAYSAYYYAKRHREIEGIGLERNIAGFPDYQIPGDCLHPNATAAQKAIKTDAENVVRKVRMNQLTGLVRPSEVDTKNNPTGYKFSLISSSGRNSLEFDPIIKRCQNEMLKAFLTQFIAFGISQVGSHALSSDMTSMLGYAIGAINTSIDDQITRDAIGPLLRLEGFPRAAWPYMKSSDVEKPKLTDISTFLSSMISSGGMEGGKDIDDFARRQIGLDAKEGPSLDELISNASSVPEIRTDNNIPLQESDESTEVATEPQEEQSPMMTIEEAAEFLSVSRQRIRNAVANGQLPGVKIGNTVRVSRENLMKLLEAA